MLKSHKLICRIQQLFSIWMTSWWKMFQDESWICGVSYFGCLNVRSTTQHTLRNVTTYICCYSSTPSARSCSLDWQKLHVSPIWEHRGKKTVISYTPLHGYGRPAQLMMLSKCLMLWQFDALTATVELHYWKYIANEWGNNMILWN